MRNSQRYPGAARAVLKVVTAMLCLIWAAAVPMESQAVESSAEGSQAGESGTGQTVESIEYENLRELLKSGNLSLRNEYEDYEENIADYQEMWDIMKWEQGNLEDKAREAQESGDENAALYSSNALSLKNSASRIYDQLESMTDPRSLRSLEKSADTSLLSAQTLMNSYGQMAWNVKAGKKRVEALRAFYSEMARGQIAGTATGADVASAKNQLDKEINSLGNLEEQAASLKRQLLAMLGMPVDSHAAIGPIPEPDLAAIDSIDFERDKGKAVNNSSTVINTRHSEATGTAARDRRAREVAEAEGKAEASIAAAYQDLIARRTEYQAALSAYESARITYESLQLRRQAGLLSNGDYLQGEADFLESAALKETASMNLVQAYESYCWEVKGVG